MKTTNIALLIFLPLALAILFWGCTSNTQRTPGVIDSDADADGDGDSDSDSDGDGDLDSEEVPGEISDNGYVTFGNNWFGYAWNEVGNSDADTIEPDNFDDLKAGENLCARGELAADGYDSYGMIAVNIHQDKGSASKADAVSLSGDGVTIELDIEQGVNVLLVELHGVRENPGDDHDVWCKKVVGYGGTYRWTDFTTRCYNNLNPGEAYAGEEIQFVSVTVPGTGDSRQFDYCIKNIVIEDDIPEEIEDLYPVKDGEVCGDVGKAHVYTQDPQVAYLFSNNVWNSTGGEQCISYENNTFRVTTQSNSMPTNGGPASFPSLIYGAKSQSEISKYTVLPKRVSELGAVTTHWSHNAGSPSGDYNAAYDVWFNTADDTVDTVSSNSLPNGAYLMVWYYSRGVQPLPSNTGQTVQIAGQSWDVWIGPGPSRANHIAYVANNKTSLTFDLKDFIDDAVSRGVVNSNHYLAAIQAGFEIWNGGVGLETRDFWVDEDSI